MITRARLPLVGTARGKASSVECIHLGGRCGGKANCHAIAGRRFAIARTSDDEGGLFTTVKHPTIAERAKVFDAERTQSGVIITGKRPTSARIISNERLPEPITIEARNSTVATPESRSTLPTS